MFVRICITKVLEHCFFILCIIINRYRGIAPPIVQKTISTSVMFGVFDFYRRLIVHYKKEFIEYVFVYVG